MPVVAPRWCLPLILSPSRWAPLRGALSGHAPLLALANSYDQARYSGCFDLYPRRRRLPPPTPTAWPEARLRWYAFRPQPVPLCAVGRLLPQAAVVAAFHADRGPRRRHAPGRAGWGPASGLACSWHCRDGLVLHAPGGDAVNPPRTANALALPPVLLDPANTLYLSTFYAEATAPVRPCSRW